MGSSKDRGGKATLNDSIGTTVDFLRLETLILHVVNTTGQFGKVLFRGNWHTDAQ